VAETYLLPASAGLELATKLSVSEWSYLGSHTATRLALERALPGVAWRSVASELETVSHRLRAPFIDLVGELAERNDGPAWWAAALGTKNPYTAPVLLHASLLRIGLDLATAPPVGSRLLVVESPAVCTTLVEYARRRGVAVRVLAEPARARQAGRASSAREWASAWRTYVRNRAALRRAGLIDTAPFAGDDTALLFTWVDERTIGDDGRYHDPKLSDALLEALRARGYRLAILARVLGSVPFDAMVRRLQQTGERCLYREALLRPADVARAIARSARARPAVPAGLTLDGLEIGGLVREQIARDRGEMADNLTYASLVRRLADAGVRPRLAIHSMEGHPWERVLAAAVAERMPDTRIVGLNSGTFTPMWMATYPTRGELRRTPLPHRIVTNGPRLDALLADAGYPPDRIASGADLRRRHLWDERPLDARPKLTPPVQVVVATEIGVDRSVELVDKAVRAFTNDAR